MEVTYLHIFFVFWKTATKKNKWFHMSKIRCVNLLISMISGLGWGDMHSIM